MVEPQASTPLGTIVALVCVPGKPPRTLEDEELTHVDELLTKPGVLVWMDVNDPGPDQIELLRGEFDLHPLAEEDLELRSQRPKVDSYPGQQVVVTYEVLPADGDGRRPLARGAEGEPNLGEIHLFAGSGYLVSVHWGSSPAIESVRHRYVKRSEAVGKSVGGLVYSILDAVVDGYFPLLDEMSEQIDDLEDRIVAGHQQSGTLRELLDVKRKLLELRRILAPQRDVANSLLRRDVELIDDESVPYYQDLYDHLVRVLDQLDLYRDLVAAVLDANLSVTSNNLNAIMKRLTAFTVVLMVPTLIAGIYGMNFRYMPELNSPIGYPLAVGAMAVLMGAIAFYFWRKDWF
jgi:magnesium transporter